MKKLLKLPLRLAALPLIAILLVFQLISSLIVGSTSIVTNLLATVFLIGSVAGWIANAPSNLIFQTAGLGIFFAFAVFSAQLAGFHHPRQNHRDHGRWRGQERKGHQSGRGKGNVPDLGTDFPRLRFDRFLNDKIVYVDLLIDLKY